MSLCLSDEDLQYKLLFTGTKLSSDWDWAWAWAWDWGLGMGIRVDWEFSVFEYSSFEPCRYQDKYFVDQSCQLNGTYICNIIKVYAIF